MHRVFATAVGTLFLATAVQVKSRDKVFDVVGPVPDGVGRVNIGWCVVGQGPRRQQRGQPDQQQREA